MFDPSSRYAKIEVATFTPPDGRSVPYLLRRFVPDSAAMPLLVQVTTVQGDRLDNITARTLGAPEQFWLVCDANNTMNPIDLVAEAGRVLRVPMPQP